MKIKRRPRNLTLTSVNVEVDLYAKFKEQLKSCGIFCMQDLLHRAMFRFVNDPAFRTEMIQYREADCPELHDWDELIQPAKPIPKPEDTTPML